jgi:serine/threonine-protein kinase RsbT
VNVVGSTTMSIRRESDVFDVRRKARALAQARGFDTFAAAALTTAASELARNVWVHGGGGEVVLEELADAPRAGIRMTFRDNGPGIANVDRVLAGGYSTVRSLGLGLSGSKRLVDEFSLETAENKGTVIVITKWTRF